MEKRIKYNVNVINSIGYTLIEILVSLTIIGILFSFGYAGFRDFSRRQALTGAAKEVQGNLRLAQEYALSGQKPDDPFCENPNNLIGYNFDVVSTSEYKIEAVCAGGIVTEKDFNLTSDILIAKPSPNPILFKILGSGTNIPSGQDVSIVLSQNGTSSETTILVGSGGEIR